MHPNAFDHQVSALNVENSLGAYFLQQAQSLMGEMYQSFGSLNSAEKKLRDAKPASQRDVRIVNGVPTVYADTVELATAAEQRWNKLAPTIDKQVKNLTLQQAALEKKVSEALDHSHRKTQEGLQLATDIRNHVKSLDEGERTKFVLDAVARGEKDVVAAVLHAPSFLSGLSSGALDNIRAQAAERFDPLHARQARAAAAVLDQLRTAGTALMMRYSTTIRLKNSAKARADEALKALAQ
jgi:hypothetical protein